MGRGHEFKCGAPPLGHAHAVRAPIGGQGGALNHLLFFELVNDGGEELTMIAKCIVSVYDEENVYEPDNLQDSMNFIESLNTQQFAKIMEFIATMPKLKHTFSYKCKGCGQEDTVTLEGLSDFF